MPTHVDSIVDNGGPPRWPRLGPGLRLGPGYGWPGGFPGVSAVR